MINPKKQFEDDKNNYDYQFNFTYIWKDKSKNNLNKNDEINKYKDKLGWYIEFYNKSENEDLFSKIYPPYKELNNLDNKISIDNKFIKNDNNFILKKKKYNL